MNVRCPNCESLYRVDPERVPVGGVLTRCSRCAEAFRVEAPGKASIERAAAQARPERQGRADARTGAAPGEGPGVETGADVGARADAEPGAEIESGPEPQPSAVPEAPPRVGGPPPAPPAPSGEVGAGASVAGLAPGDEPRPTPAGPPEGPDETAATPSATPATGDEHGPRTAPPLPGGGTTRASASTARPRTPVFGKQDPDTRAQRIARALVSDMVVYNADRRDRSLEQGTLRSDFKEEILKSWEEYVEQVGQEMARTSPHFRDALNEILARGQPVF